MSTMHVTIRHNANGETRTIRLDGMEAWVLDAHDGIGSGYWWEEGNASCDCNRGMWFHGDDCGSGEHPCGDGAYTVLSITQDNDPTVLYAETSPGTPPPGPAAAPEAKP